MELSVPSELNALSKTKARSLVCSLSERTVLNHERSSTCPLTSMHHPKSKDGAQRAFLINLTVSNDYAELSLRPVLHLPSQMITQRRSGEIIVPYNLIEPSEAFARSLVCTLNSTQ
jgi:hypothetical protein